MNYREKTHCENNFSINSSKYELKTHHLICIQKRQVLPLPLIAQCGQFGRQFSKPQVPGKTTLHALSFDPSNFQFWAQILCFQAHSKHERCVCGYGMLIVAYTGSVCGFPEIQSRTVRDLPKRHSRMLHEVKN